MKNDAREPWQNPRKNGAAQYLRYLHVGVQFSVAVGLLTWGGVWLDERFDTKILFTLLGLALGFGGGLRAMYVDLYGSKNRSRRKEKDGSRRKEDGPRRKEEDDGRGESNL